MAVVVRKAWNVYAAVVMAVIALAGVVPCMGFVCGRGGAGGVEPAVAAGLAGSILVATILGHEIIHYAVARLLGVPGLTIRLLPRLGAIALDYDYMTPRQYVVVALAPQLLTVALAAFSLYAPPPLPPFFCLAAIANFVGGVPDVFLAFYFPLAHPRARRYMLLYDERGVAGGVIEEEDRIVVYVF